MADQHDGSIIIDCELDTEGLAKGSDELLQAIKSLSNQVKTLGETIKTTFSGSGQAAQTASADMQKYEQTVMELENKVKTLQQTIDEMKNTGGSGDVGGLGQTKAKASDLEKEILSVAKSVEKLGPTFERAMSGDAKAISTLEAKLGPLQNQVAGLQQKLTQAGEAKIPTDDYTAICQAVQKADAALLKLYDRQDKMKATGVKEGSQAWKSLQYDIEVTTQALNRYQAQKALMEANGTSHVAMSTTAAYQSMSGTLSAVSGQLGAMSSSLSQTNGATTQATSSANRFGTILKKIGSVALKSIGGVAKGAFRGLVGSIKLAGKGLSSLISKFHKTRKASKGLGKHLKSIGFMLKQMLAFRLLYAIFEGITQGFQNLAQASDGANKDLSALKSGLTQLKNSLAAAFAPILTVVTPILTNFMSQMSAAISKIGEFIAALTGAKTFTKAVAVQEDYAASLKGTSAAAKDAKKQLAGFDDLNVLSDNSSDKGTVDPKDMFEEAEVSSPILDMANQLKEAFKSGDFESIGQKIGEKINSAISSIGNAVSWDKVGGTVTSFVSGIAGAVNTLVSTIDWAGAGQTVANGVNTIVNSIYLWVTGVDWKLIGGSIATGLNGAIAGVDWRKLGNTIGSYFNMALHTLLGFVQNFDWAAAGTELSTGLNGILESVDWAGLGTFISDGFIGALRFIRSAISTFDWLGLGGNVADCLNQIDWVGAFGEAAGALSDATIALLDLLIGFVVELDWNKLGQDVWNSVVAVLQNIDWNGVISKAFELLGAAVGGAAQLVLGFVQALWESLKAGFETIKTTYFEPYMNEMGEMTIEGFFQGILDMLADIGNWIVTNIFDPFINGFKAAFGIHSPSTVMEEQGDFIIQGLLGGIKAAWGSITEFFSESLGSVKETLSDAWSNIKEGASKAWGKVTETVSGAWSDAKEALSDAKTWGEDVCKNMADGISKAKSKVTEAVTSVAEKIKSFLGFSEPEDGPLSNFHTYMPDMLDLMEKGIRDNEYKAVNAAAGVAKAISHEVQNGDYTTGDIVASGKIDSTLVNISDKIADSFTNLLDRLQAIASGVTFASPVAASGVVPYQVSATASGSNQQMENTLNANNEALMALLARLFPQAVNEIVAAIHSSGNNNSNGLDLNAVTTYVIGEINRRTNMIGLTPIVR